MRSATIRDHDTGIFLCVLQREGNRLKTSVIIVIHDVAIIITDGVLRFERTPCKSSCPRTHDTPTFSLSPLHPSLSLSLSLLSFFSASRKFFAERKKLRQFVRRGHQKGNRVRPRVKKQPSVVPASRFTGTKRTRAFPLLAICEWVKLAVSWSARLGW